MKNKIATRQIKISYFFLGLAVLSLIIHNAVYALFEFEEPVFFLLALLLGIAFIASVFYNTFYYFKKGKPEDLWKLGWLGLFGLLGIVANPGLFGFFGFFAFFGLKK